jgi:putative ATP-dependent endonuclease of OLD family
LDGNLRIAFEIPEKPGLPCGRSFEEAFILANPNLFDITTLSEKEASDKADEQDKTDFALEFAIYKTNWIVPRYISEGLLWLAKINQPSKLVAPALEVGKQDIKLT